MSSVSTQIFVSHRSYLVIINFPNNRGQHIHCFSNKLARKHKPRHFWASILFVVQLNVPGNIKNYLKPEVHTLIHSLNTFRLFQCHSPAFFPLFMLGRAEPQQGFSVGMEHCLHQTLDFLQSFRNVKVKIKGLIFPSFKSLSLFSFTSFFHITFNVDDFNYFKKIFFFFLILLETGWGSFQNESTPSLCPSMDTTEPVYNTKLPKLPLPQVNHRQSSKFMNTWRIGFMSCKALGF